MQDKHGRNPLAHVDGFVLDGFGQRTFTRALDQLDELAYNVSTNVFTTNKSRISGKALIRKRFEGLATENYFVKT
jgi:hypothetical protein